MKGRDKMHKFYGIFLWISRITRNLQFSPWRHPKMWRCILITPLFLKILYFPSNRLAINRWVIRPQHRSLYKLYNKIVGYISGHWKKVFTLNFPITPFVSTSSLFSIIFFYFEGHAGLEWSVIGPFPSASGSIDHQLVNLESQLFNRFFWFDCNIFDGSSLISSIAWINFNSPNLSPTVRLLIFLIKHENYLFSRDL